MKAMTVMAAAALVLTTAAPVPARAQQTPENASRFLKILADQGGMAAGAYYEDDTWKGWNSTRTCKYCTVTHGPDHKVLTWDSMVDCMTRYTADSIAGLKWLNWRKLSGVSVVDRAVEFRYNLNKFRLSFGSPDLAARAAQAMEVIRASCDATAGTGF